MTPKWESPEIAYYDGFGHGRDLEVEIKELKKTNTIPAKNRITYLEKQIENIRPNWRQDHPWGDE